MNELSGTNRQPADEFHDLRQGIGELAQSESGRRQTEDLLHQEYSFRNTIINNVAEGLCVCHETVE